ncbi:Putative outer membrane protein [hydrothermal vent metagenome]|uniref:Outer membrane protein n=1 Tax=hydrothermal vent metagenome TaxID=652676 RepID=A0A3B1D265_9ZZZZ
MKTLVSFLLFDMFLATLLVPAYAQEKISGKEIIKQSQKAFYYAGNDMKSKIEMTLINKAGKKRFREMTMLRINVDGTLEQKFYIYFHRPADVRGTSFLVLKYPDKDDDRWLFISAIKLVKRIASSDQFSSFVGSDFTYEDISGRDLEADKYRLVKTEQINGKSAYVVESTPISVAAYTRKISWIDTNTFLPLKEEYYDIQKELYKIFSADQIEDVKGIPTIMKRSITNVKRGHRTEVLYKTAEYGLGMPNSVFTERSLRRPPLKWIK